MFSKCTLKQSKIPSRTYLRMSSSVLHNKQSYSKSIGVLFHIDFYFRYYSCCLNFVLWGKVDSIVYVILVKVQRYWVLLINLPSADIKLWCKEPFCTNHVSFCSVTQCHITLYMSNMKNMCELLRVIFRELPFILYELFYIILY